MIYLILFMYMCEWWLYAFTDNTWSFEIGSKSFVIACLSGYILSISSKIPLLSRSAIAVITLTAWCDFIVFMAWHLTNTAFDLSIPAALIFFIWLIFAVRRSYPERIDLINMDHVNLLILKPRSNLDVIKALFGFPAASICISSQHKIWSFRSKSNSFEESEYNIGWHGSYLVIDTGIKCTDDFIIELRKLIGTRRFPCIKCVWVIRHVLNRLGGKYRIKTWLDYIPGLYLMRIIPWPLYRLYRSNCFSP